MGLAALPLCFAPPLLLLLPGFFGFIAMAWGPACLGVAVGVSSLCVFLVSGAGDFTTALLLLSLYLPASLVLCYCLTRRRPWRSAALGGSLAMALGLYVLLCLRWALRRRWLIRSKPIALTCSFPPPLW